MKRIKYIEIISIRLNMVGSDDGMSLGSGDCEHVRGTYRLEPFLRHGVQDRWICDLLGGRIWIL